MREALTEVVRRAGYRASESPSAEAALTDSALDVADLVISDLRMPGMDGLEFLHRVRGRRADLPVVLITAHGTVETAVEAMRRGAFDFVMKPFRPHDIESVIRRALADLGARSAPAAKVRGADVIAADARMLEILELARTVARSQATVLLQGESGTGKEVLARFLHAHSPRREGPFVAVNCAALPEGLLESELFGHERGAFTGALRAAKGKFELADRGTILLDEISEIAPTLQAKLLRVLQEREVDPVGARSPVPVDIRVIAT
ncbi:MAG: sigma-54-dependent Fis family transcriptional regulator, partial [Myxococcales bacterium]|nr:sigma-54-dependent Fis family transcriptional regulator [Myxococcales bacterium]